MSRSFKWGLLEWSTPTLRGFILKLKTGHEFADFSKISFCFFLPLTLYTALALFCVLPRFVWTTSSLPLHSPSFWPFQHSCTGVECPLFLSFPTGQTSSLCFCVCSQHSPFHSFAHTSIFLPSFLLCISTTQGTQAYALSPSSWPSHPFPFLINFSLLIAVVSLYKENSLLFSQPTGQKWWLNWWWWFCQSADLILKGRCI